METKQLIIPVAVFAVIWVLRWVLRSSIGDKIPKMVWPIVAPALGLALDYGMAQVGFLTQTDPAMGALLGAAGVNLREIINQIAKAASPPPETTTPK